MPKISWMAPAIMTQPLVKAMNAPIPRLGLSAPTEPTNPANTRQLEARGPDADGRPSTKAETTTLPITAATSPAMMPDARYSARTGANTNALAARVMTRLIAAPLSPPNSSERNLRNAGCRNAEAARIACAADVDGGAVAAAALEVVKAMRVMTEMMEMTWASLSFLTSMICTIPVLTGYANCPSTKGCRPVCGRDFGEYSWIKRFTYLRKS